ncbi:hypothetical protein HPB47_003733, partial [Ixodes persulcatus]
ALRAAQRKRHQHRTRRPRGSQFRFREPAARSERSEGNQHVGGSGRDHVPRASALAALVRLTPQRHVLAGREAIPYPESQSLLPAGNSGVWG